MNAASPPVRQSFDSPEDFLNEMEGRSRRAQGGPPPSLDALLAMLGKPQRPPLWYRAWRTIVGIASVLAVGVLLGLGIKVGFVAFAYALTWF